MSYRFIERFIALASLAGTAIWAMAFGTPCHAQHVRYDAHSVEGKKMLAIYARAVGKMKVTPSRDPNSWTFQWYSHAVRGDKTKARELIATFAAGPGFH